MVETGYAFRNSSDMRGTPIYQIDGVDRIAAGALYDRLRENFAGLSLGFYDYAGVVCIPHSRAKPLPDGMALHGQLDALSNDSSHAYVASLNGRHLALLINYAQRPARRGGPSSGSDIDGSRGRRDSRFEIMETEKTKIKSLTIAENLEAVSDKFKLHAWQWDAKDATQLTPECVSPKRMQRILASKVRRFVQRASLSPKVD